VDRHGSFWGAQAASLLVSATCRNNLLRIKFRLREIVAANLSVTVRLVACAAHADFLRRPIDPVADVHCPRCRTLGGHKFAPQYRGSISHAALHFGGFLFSIFYSGGRQQRFRCRECKELFYSHTALSRGYRLLFLLSAAFIVNSIWSEFSEFWAAGG